MQLHVLKTLYQYAILNLKFFQKLFNLYLSFFDGYIIIFFKNICLEVLFLNFNLE